MKALVVDKVSRKFGGLWALEDVCLEVDVGERRVIIGPNGAGKTTLFHIVSGVLPPTSGMVYLFGKPINEVPMHRRVGLGISQTFQLINLFKGLTVLENAILAVQRFKRVKFSLYLPLSRYKDAIEEAEQLLMEWSLWDKAHIKVSDLSYGEQRLLDIALAMASKPQLLLLDEPTSGLPLSEVETVVSRINNLNRGITVLVIEHNMDVALSLADKVTVLHRGQVAAEGVPAEIKQDPRVREIYLGDEK